jgi:hypothetical protein
MKKGMGEENYIKKIKMWYNYGKVPVAYPNE